MKPVSDHKTEITARDILPMAEYGRIRRQRRSEMVALKKKRRVAVGPHATFYFENYDTMWTQIHEMLFVEQGGEAQIADELEAYNPLIPKGRELVATLMFEIDDERKRTRFLNTIGGIEEAVRLWIGDDKIIAAAETDIDRTTADGKASSVHFVHFPFDDGQIAAFKDPDRRVMLGFEHPNYSHMAVLGPETRKALAEDFA